ncbi:MAG: GNAT family N-acetyltransferase [Pseudomonadota bacterium]
MDSILPPALPPASGVRLVWQAGIETERLILRPVSAACEADWLALHQDPEVARYVIGEAPTQADSWRDLAFVIGHAQLRGFSTWAVYEKRENSFIGRAGPWMPQGWPGLEIGWAFAAHGRGKGYATEAVVAALRWSFKHLHAAVIIHSIQADNVRSQKLAHRIGAQQLGTAEVHGAEHGIWVTQRAQYA